MQGWMPHASEDEGHGALFKTKERHTLMKSQMSPPWISGTHGNSRYSVAFIRQGNPLP